MSELYTAYDSESSAISDVLGRAGLVNGVLVVAHEHVDEYMVFEHFSDVVVYLRGVHADVREGAYGANWADFVSEYNVWMYWRQDDARDASAAIYARLSGNETYRLDRMEYEAHQAHMASYLGYGVRTVAKDVYRDKLDVKVLDGDDLITVQVWSEL